MIVVLAGTSEGRLLARALAARGARVVACTATAYGGELLADALCTVHAGPLNEESLSRLIREQGAGVLVDATHPFAREISALAAQVAARCGIPCLRYRRPAVSLPDDPLIHLAGDFPAAAELAPRLGRTIFLATGSKTLAVFVPPAVAAGCRVVARVLPDDRTVGRCLALGLSPADIVAVQGPCGKEMNLALLRHFRAEVMVSKEDGEPGGLAGKAAACLELGLPLVVVGRPGDEPAGDGTLEEICERAARLDEAGGGEDETGQDG